MSLERASVLRLNGDLAGAYAILDKELKARPTDTAVWKEFAALTVTAKDWERAESVLTALHEANPLHPEPCYQLAALHDTLGDYEQAMTWARRSWRNIPHEPKGATLAYTLAGEISYKMGNPEFGAKMWDFALQAPCTDGPSMFAKAEILLARGRWKEGWQAFEHRWRIAEQWRIQRMHQTDVASLPPEWDGKACDGVVLVAAEQGTGDTIQFLRYLQYGPVITLQCQPELIAFVKQYCDYPDVRVVPNGERVEAKYSCPIMSLPYKMEMADIIPPSADAVPRELVPRIGRLRVGVCWKGSPDHANDKDRSCPVNLYDVIRALPNVEAVSLQHGEPTRFRDFAATAEVIESCDLVVTVDTAVLHLAGTLGVPTICIPPTRPEFRFPLTHQDTTPWYPSVTVVRRTRSDAWQPAIDRVVHLIQEKANG